MKWNRKFSRKKHQINTSFMADISFLALIFFLLTFVKPEEKGLLVKLPPFCIDNWCGFGCGRGPATLYININAQNKILVGGEIKELVRVTQSVKDFILNVEENPSWRYPKTPKQAVISLQCDRETSYDAYIQTYNEIKRAYNEIWDEAALIRFGFYFEDLKTKQQIEIKSDFPYVVSEAEPTDYFNQ